MKLRVVGAGLGRTGTLSLKAALEKLLGAPCYHMLEVFTHPAHMAVWTAASRGQPVDWDRLLRGYAATVDWPACAFWKPLSELHPDALILLSTRDAQSWYESASSTIFQSAPKIPAPGAREMIEALFGNTFTLAWQDRAACIAAFEAHNARVRAEAPRGRLLEWTAAEGWGPICEALGVSVPDEPFPRVNTREEFLARAASGQPPGPPTQG
jgi:hypothetical protein